MRIPYQVSEIIRLILSATQHQALRLPHASPCSAALSVCVTVTLSGRTSPPPRPLRAASGAGESLTLNTMSHIAAAPDGSHLPVAGNGDARRHAGFLALTIGSIGVVYGDIGTSPLYAFREAIIAASAGGAVTREAVLGVLSLIFWALVVIVTLKYVLILLRADNNGEGGTLTLMALAQRALGKSAPVLVLLGTISGALFYGDAVITPALSVLSAVEGLKVATPAFEPYVVPLTVIVLVGLFAVQSRGTAQVAAFFGPITLVWFIAIAIP